jgi:hypothetical protein
MTVIRNKKIFMLIPAFTGWFALAVQMYVLVSNTPGNGLTPLEAVGRFFIFFTILSNILVAVSLTILLVNPHSASGRYFNKASVITAIALYILIVGLVYNIILRSLWHPAGLQKLADELLHVAIPLLFIVYWFFFASKKGLTWMHPFRWLIFPALYLVYVLIRGALEGFYPYPFIDANELSFGRVFMNSFGLMFVFLAVGFLFVAVGKMISRKKG